MSDFAAPDAVPAVSVDVRFPFSAVVGQHRLQLALLLCAVHPAIGGVLVRGEKGTAKSTVVRALAGLLPPVITPQGTRPARLVELPLGATEDRVVGSVDVELVLREGQQAFRPGLLARADQGVLYVDEVNLLPDHLVDVLLDAAAMGRAHIERDGVSYSHPSRFVLVGTMNPEEGELRPQLLDRFGLTVDVAASQDVDVRMAIVRQRLAFEADPEEFAARHAEEDAALASRIVAARALVAEVVLDDTELRRIAALCAACEVDGMRADLVVARTATAHAAWRGAKAVTSEDVRVAAELALPHRRRRDPFDEPGITPEQLDEALGRAAEEVERAEDDGNCTDNSQQAPQPPPDPDPDDDPDGGPGGASPPESRTATPTPLPGRPPKWEVAGIGEGAPGRRSRAQTRNGRVVEATRYQGSGLHLLGTVVAAIPEQYSRGRRSGALRLLPRDVRGARREGRESNLVIFAVDTSGSMAARDRLRAVTGAVVTLLRDVYQRRDKVAVITLRGQDATVAVPPTSSIDIAVRRLTGLPTGGKTPVAAGLLCVRDLVRRERLRDPTRRALVVVLTDGRATGGVDPVGRARGAARLLSRDGVGAVVVDCEHGLVRLGLAADLARDLRGQCLTIQELSDANLAQVVRSEVGDLPRAA